MVTQQEIVNIVREGQQNGKTYVVAQTDVLIFYHVGHVRYLQKTKEFADYLIVMLNSDTSC